MTTAKADPPADWAAWMRGAFERLPPAAGSAAQARALALDLAEERAAIIEYDGCVPRLRAESLAYEAYEVESAHTPEG